MAEDSSLSDALQVTNPIGGALTYEIVDTATHGNFTLNNDGSYSYNPQANYNGADAITIKVTNEYGLSTIKTIDLAITSVNDLPIFANTEDESYILKNTRMASGVIVASDVDGDTLTYTLSTNPTHGTLTLDQNGQWSYESAFGYKGEDRATISVSDGKGGMITKDLTFTSQGLVYEGGNLTISAQTISDTLELGTIGMDALSFTKSGNNLAITVANNGVITISDYFIKPNQTLTTLNTSWGEINLGKEAIKQASGSWWWPFGNATASNGQNTLLVGSSYSDELTGASGNDILFGAANNDTLNGVSGNDLLLGGAGDDALYGGKDKDILYGDGGSDCLQGAAGDDNLIGGAGNDTLYGDSGHDRLNGGTGKDFLQGGTGNDTYYVNTGDGKDTIEDVSFNFCSWNYPDGGEDTLQFGQGIDKEDITFLMKNGNLSIKYGATDTIVIEGQSNAARAIEKFTLSDGSFMTSDDVGRIIQEMSAYAIDKGIHLTSNNTIENNQALMQIVSSSWHNA